MIISPLSEKIIRCNFNDVCPRVRSLDIRKHLSKFLNLTRLLGLQKWIKMAPSVPRVKYVRTGILACLKNQVKNYSKIENSVNKQ